ncbi:MAG: SPOR domain-containing protein [Ignavibacteriae bacterium]|nr:SPOR domain-containing protein [Ignavibacteriota bacterium]
MNHQMNFRHGSVLRACVLAAVLFMTGCSASEDTAKENTGTPGEFTSTDKREVVIPATDQPPKATTIDPAPVQPATVRDAEAAEPEKVGQPPVPEAAQAKPEAQKTGLMMWSVQIGAFKSEAGAAALITEARSKFNVPVYKDFDAVSGLFKVTVGSFPTREQASQFKEDVLAKGYTGAFTTEVRR